MSWQIARTQCRQPVYKRRRAEEWRAFAFLQHFLLTALARPTSVKLLTLHRGRHSSSTMSTQVCFDCGRTVYPAERVEVQVLGKSRVYHKSCIKCHKCQSPLTYAICHVRVRLSHSLLLTNFCLCPIRVHIYHSPTCLAGLARITCQWTLSCAECIIDKRS